MGEFYARAGPRNWAGMTRLADAQVLAQWEGCQKPLAEGDVTECAALARGGDAHDRYFSLLLEHAAVKDPKLLQSWIGARMTMLRAAYAELLGRMPAQDGARFTGLCSKVAQANDEAACWFARQMLDGVRVLSAPHQAVLARVMLKQPVEP